MLGMIINSSLGVLQGEGVSHRPSSVPDPLRSMPNFFSEIPYFARPSTNWPSFFSRPVSRYPLSGPGIIWIVISPNYAAMPLSALFELRCLLLWFVLITQKQRRFVFVGVICSRFSVPFQCSRFFSFYVFSYNAHIKKQVQVSSLFILTFVLSA